MFVEAEDSIACGDSRGQGRDVRFGGTSEGALCGAVAASAMHLPKAVRQREVQIPRSCVPATISAG